MEELNYPLAFAPMSIRYPDKEGYMMHIGYIPNMCYVVSLDREYNSDGTYISRYKVVFIDKIVDLENKKIETNIPKYEGRDFRKYCCNCDYTDDIAFDYDDALKICEIKNRNLYTIKTFTPDEKIQYLNKLKEHKKLLTKSHSSSCNYKTLFYKMKRRDAKL